MTGIYKDVPWEIYASDTLPERNLITATACLAKKDENIVIVENAKRGWEYPGGHVEENEDLTKAIRREVLEEGSCEINDPIFIGYQAFTPHEPFKTYPFPTSYIVYYSASVTHVLPDRPYDLSEIIRRAILPVPQIKELLSQPFQKQLADLAFSRAFNPK